MHCFKNTLLSFIVRILLRIYVHIFSCEVEQSTSRAFSHDFMTQTREIHLCPSLVEFKQGRKITLEGLQLTCKVAQIWKIFGDS